jgi:TPR repeat protein
LASLQTNGYPAKPDEEVDDPMPKDTLATGKSTLAEYMKVVNEFPLAAFRIGDYYFFGKGIEVNTDEAIKYLDIAVKGDNGDAIDLLGFMYLTGKGIARDEQRRADCLPMPWRRMWHMKCFALGCVFFERFGGWTSKKKKEKKNIYVLNEMSTVLCFTSNIRHSVAQNY